jgi:hypothetical protein
MIIPYPHGTTPARRAVSRYHMQHTIRRSTTSLPHHAHSYHASTTGVGTTSLAQRAWTSEMSAFNQKGTSHHAAPAAQRVGIQLPRARPNEPSKKHRSRARSGQLQCRVSLPSHKTSMYATSTTSSVRANGYGSKAIRVQFVPQYIG